MRTVELELVADGRGLPKELGANDDSLVFAGESYKTSVSRAGSVGRVLRAAKHPQTASFVLFSFHRPSKAVQEVMDSMGEEATREKIVVAYKEGKFFLMEKRAALELCGGLACV